MKSISFKVDFPPTPWKRPAGKAQRYDSQVAEKEAFGLLVWQQVNLVLPAVGKEPFFGKHLPLTAVYTFGMKRPPTSKLAFPTDKSDTDNLAKFVNDALQSGCLKGRLWHDDGQIVDSHQRKLWADSDFISCTIEEFLYVE